jgi:hypothetical protein
MTYTSQSMYLKRAKKHQTPLFDKYIRKKYWWEELGWGEEGMATPSLQGPGPRKERLSHCVLLVSMHENK